MARRNAVWTVIVYLAGDNNLTTECMFALTEMKHAAFGKHLNVVAQFDPSDPHLPTHRYHIRRRGKKKSFRHAACLTGPPAKEEVITDDSDTGSALNVCKVERLREEIDKLAQLMQQQLVAEWRESGVNARERPFHDALLLAHWEAQSYNGEQFIDLFDFCDRLETRLAGGVVVEQCRTVKEFLSNDFVLTSCYSGAAYQISKQSQTIAPPLAFILFLQRRRRAATNA